MTETLLPLIVQGDGTLFLETDNDPDHRCRDAIARFCEIVKSPEHVHTYRITPLAVWNAASSGITLQEIENTMNEFSRYPVPANVQVEIRDWYHRYGKIKLVREMNAAGETVAMAGIPDTLFLESDDPMVIEEILSRKTITRFIRERIGNRAISVDAINRGRLKQALIKIGYPVDDRVGFLPGDPVNIRIREDSQSTGLKFSLRSYQVEAVESFVGPQGRGSGIVVLPSGAGKTLVGMGAIEKIGENTLIITPGTVAARQWIRELKDKTTIDPSMIGEYSGDTKEIMPLTVTTYQVLTYSPRSGKRDKNGDMEPMVWIEGDHGDQEVNRDLYPHLDIFRARNWGLIIYDEVHLLPAPVFRITSEIQAKRRLGLTATLVREDGKEDDVFSLIGPKRYDSPWKDLERQGWIAAVECFEVRTSFFSREYRMQYAVSEPRNKYRIAAENPRKAAVVEYIISNCSPDDSVLVIGDYLEQLEIISERLNFPLITGKTRNDRREELYGKFRNGDIHGLVLSKVGNYAIDLPDANVAIQVSGTFGSRQEEAQRIGRVLRPKKDNRAKFYTIVTADSVDQEFSMKRQLFLTERGYRYNILHEKEFVADLEIDDKRAEG